MQGWGDMDTAVTWKGPTSRSVPQGRATFSQNLEIGIVQEKVCIQEQIYDGLASVLTMVSLLVILAILRVLVVERHPCLGTISMAMCASRMAVRDLGDARQRVLLVEYMHDSDQRRERPHTSLYMRTIPVEPRDGFPKIAFPLRRYGFPLN